MKNLLKSMKTLLEEYGYTYSTSALNTILDEWASQKGWLIELFKKHPNYIEGQYMIAYDTDYVREVNEQELGAFQRWLINNGVYSMVDTLPEEINEQRMHECCSYLPDRLFNFVTRIDSITQRTINEELCDQLEAMVPAIHPHVGQKTTRVINKLLTYLNYSKHPEYNKMFARYADALNPLVIKRHTILSLNPLDYLTMSFGNSWASCHTIDKTNKRGMPNSYEGMYSSGTMSYMLDPSSMVFYTVDKSYEGIEYWTQPKITRQMFHFGEDKLVQGRLYPQDNDSCKNQYTEYRNLVQEIMALILEVPNLWNLRIGTRPASEYIRSYGTHYCDYEYYSNCSLSTLKGSDNQNTFPVGAEPICIECGYRHHTESNINCCHDNSKIYCDDCGREIDEEDAIYIDGIPYCRNCVNYCDHCEEYHRGETTWIAGSRRYVCNHCLDNYAYCDECGEWYSYDETTYIEHEGIDVCDNCLRENFSLCEQCDEYFRTEEMYEHDGNLYCEDCHNKINNAC